MISIRPTPSSFFNMRHQQLFCSFFCVTVLGRAWDCYIPESNVAYQKLLQNIGDRTPTLGNPVILVSEVFSGG